MKKYILYLLSSVVLFAAACEGGDRVSGADDDTFSIMLQSISPATTKVNIRLTSTGLERFGYIVEPRTADYVRPTAEEILADGLVSKVALSGSISFAVDKLMPGTDYAFSFVGIAADNTTTAVQTELFSTATVEGFALIEKRINGFSAYVGTPSSVAEGNVVKWAVTDIVRYALNGGDTGVVEMLNADERVAKNVVERSTRIDVTTCDGADILPGQPMWVLVGEFAEGQHAEWGAGHYTPAFTIGTTSGYFHKEKIVTGAPSALSASATLTASVRSNGTGKLVINPDAGVQTLHYMVLDEERYAALSHLLENKPSYMQWFVGSATAREYYGAKSATGAVAIDCSTLVLEKGKKYYLMVTLWGDAKGWSQGYKELSFMIPPAEPVAADNNIVAHRGGSKEAGAATPDNSIASLRYAQRLGCYASEADIYWTKDNRVIVAHADGSIKINGLHPWEHTLAELQSSGRLSNGETLPTLEEYLTETMKEGSCTKLWLDVKNCYVSSSQPGHDYVVKATQRSCEIIHEMGAEKWVEFIHTGYEPPLAASKAAADAIGVPFAWMANKYAATYANKGVKWANLDVKYIKDGISDTSDAIHTVESFTDRGIALSVYTIDDVTTVDYYAKRSDIKAITTNYPSRMLSRLKNMKN